LPVLSEICEHQNVNNSSSLGGSEAWDLFFEKETISFYLSDLLIILKKANIFFCKNATFVKSTTVSFPDSFCSPSPLPIKTNQQKKKKKGKHKTCLMVLLFNKPLSRKEGR